MPTFTVAGSDRSIDINEAKVLVVGFSGRDPEAVRKHVDELAHEGIAAPAELPHVWEFGPELLSQNTSIPARPGRTSGEAEPVLILSNGSTFVTVGSDHTDRELERTSLDEAKRACKKVVSHECWRLEDVRDRWDNLRLESKAEHEDDWQPYQDATLREILPVDWFLERFQSAGDAIVFCGTVPTVNGMDTRATGFEAALTDPDSGNQLRCQYRIEPGGVDG